jgi:hypothetical protein
LLAIGLVETKGLIGLVAATGAIVHAFTTGTMVQVFRLAGKVTEDVWNERGPGDQSHTGA